MENRLAGVQIKIIRGLEHLQALHEKGREFLDKKPYGCRFEPYLDERRERRVRARVAISADPPVGLGLLAGEAVYHLRGALDHLVYQLALLNKTQPRGTQFPLALDEAQYRAPPAPGKKSPRDAVLDGVSKTHRAIIDEFQPYHDGARAKQNPLYVLSQFANADKHRLIQTAYGRPHSVKVEPTVEGIDLDLRIATPRPPVEDGAEVFSVRWIDGYADVPMKWGFQMRLIYGAELPDYVSRHYLVGAGMRVHEVVKCFMDVVPEFGGKGM